jgi:hypothetical protein
MPDQIAIPDYISDSPIDSSPQGGAFVPRIRMMLTFVELVGACKDLFQSWNWWERVKICSSLCHVRNVLTGQ